MRGTSSARSTARIATSRRRKSSSWRISCGCGAARQTELIHNSYALLDERGLAKAYTDVPGLCKAASLAEIEAQGWSLNPGRYVGATAREAEAEDFREKLEELQEEFERLTGEAPGHLKTRSLSELRK